ncbi:Hypothetical predicted protein [Mytilus galloprovincialis]|uniref:Reverse transcriptase domain-containing protein n=1 Tax=Mytilus galloprovincialis TaxID=29158 RepID=A0A8B6EMN0_MYTGA|nr:Hypothetical predicted protein [Mytilus galloprovincialis]
MEIIVSCKSDKEKNGRLTLLKKISYYYELYDWKALLQFYAAWIRRVESGQNKWSDDTADIETPLLASSVRSRQNRTDIANFLEYGFPLSCEGSCSGLSEEKNHAGARSHPDDMRKYLKKECTYVDSLVELIRRKGSGSLCFKRDLKRAYRQIPICPGDWHLVGFSWENHIFFDRVLSMGLRSAAYICQRVTNAVSFILDAHYDLQIVNYLDDLAGCDVQEKAFDAYAILGEVLDNCGLEESVEKASSSFYIYGFSWYTL